MMIIRYYITTILNPRALIFGGPLGILTTGFSRLPVASCIWAQGLARLWGVLNLGFTHRPLSLQVVPFY